MAVCNSCGTQNMPTAKFCQGCGKPMEESASRDATISADSLVIGKTCPYCQAPIKPGVNVVLCPVCGMPHHSECWAENGHSCTTFGCQGRTAAGDTEQQREKGESVSVGSPVHGDAGFIVPCPHCGVPNRLRRDRNMLSTAACGSCHRPLSVRPLEGKAPRPAVPADPVAIDGYSKFVIGCCLLSGLVSIAAIIQATSFKTTLATFSRTRNYTSSFENAADSFDGMTTASAIASILLGIIFLVWIYRSYKTLRQFYQPGDIRFTPGWAVGWFFIPIASLFKPYQVMRELFNKSQPADETQRFRHGGTATAWWWGLTLVSFFVARVAGKIGDEVERTKSLNVFAKLQNYADARMFDEVVYLALLVATGFIVYKVAFMLAIKSRESAWRNTL